MTRYVTNAIIFIDSYINNRAYSILLLALLVRIILFPALVSQKKFQEVTRRLQPEVDKIRQTSRDKAEADAKVATLYKDENLNPLAGILPAIFQVVVMISTFGALRNPSFLKAGDSFFGWALSSADPTYVFPVLSTALLVLSSIQTMQTSSQSLITPIALSGMIFFFSLKFSVILHLYMIASSILTLFQDFIIRIYRWTQ